MTIWLTNVYTGKTEVVRSNPVGWLYQDKEWRNAHGTIIQIKDISPTYAKNIRRLLQRQVASLHLADVRHMIEFIDGPLGPSGDWARDSAQQALDELMDEDPLEWLEETSLMKALAVRSESPS